MGYLDDRRYWAMRDLLDLAHSPPKRKLIWYRPPLRDLVRHMDWWWALVPLSATLGIGLLAAGIALARTHLALAWLGGRILLATAILPLIFWEHLRDKTIRARPDPLCIHCGWTLTGLPEEGRCPECGQPYRLKVVNMFRRDPQWIIAYWRLNGRPPSVELFESQHPARSVPPQ